MTSTKADAPVNHMSNGTGIQNPAATVAPADIAPQR
jgi:hypothetical protein